MVSLVIGVFFYFVWYCKLKNYKMVKTVFFICLNLAFILHDPPPRAIIELSEELIDDIKERTYKCPR